jgi:integrase
VVLLRLTGGRLNEVLRMKLDQFNWKKRTVRLYASKTENERDVPLSKASSESSALTFGRALLSLNRSALTRPLVAVTSYSVARQWRHSITASLGPASELLVWLSSIMGKRTDGHATAFDTHSSLIS